MKTRAEIYCELLNDLVNMEFVAGYDVTENHSIAMAVSARLLEKFEEIDVIIWNEKTQKFEVRK